jgi:hypothetical protein
MESLGDIDPTTISSLFSKAYDTCVPSTEPFLSIRNHITARGDIVRRRI